MELHPYLGFDGQCAEAFDFYAAVLGGEVVFKLTWGEAPGPTQCAEDEKGRIMHARLRIGDRAILGGDAPAKFYTKPDGFSVSLTYPAAEEARRVFDALAEGGEVRMPFAPTFWATGFGALVDRFGTPWIIGTSQAPEGAAPEGRA